MKPLNVPEPINSPDDLIAARRALNISQAMLADAIGVNAQAISMLESGKSALTRRTGHHLALLFAYVALKQNAAASALAPATPLALKPLGRPPAPEKLNPKANYTLYQTLDGAPLTYTAAREVPSGTRLRTMQATGRLPVEGRDPWQYVVRYAHPSMPFRETDAAGVLLPSPWDSLPAAPVPTQARRAHLDPALESEWQAHMRAADKAIESM